jgi:hypothetical protein
VTYGQKLTNWVCIPAYQRAELLLDRVKELESLSAISGLMISVDGLRPDAGELERNNRSELIKTAWALAGRCHFPVEVKVWEHNLGVNDHAARIFKLVKDKLPYLLIIEEDVSVSHSGLQFLIENIGKSGIHAVTTFSPLNHFNSEPTATFSTLFPNQWGFAISGEIMTQYLWVYETKKIEFSRIYTSFRSRYKSLFGQLEIYKLAIYWANHFASCIREPNNADGIIQYSVISLGHEYILPSHSLSRDVAPLNDYRSMNRRSESFSGKTELCNETQFEVSKTLLFCSKCEKTLSRFAEVNLKTILGGTKYRIQKDYLQKLV